MNKTLITKLGEQYLTMKIGGKCVGLVHVDVQTGSSEGKRRPICVYANFYIERDKKTPAKLVKQFFKDISLELDEDSND